jgi:hypothetical protein
MIKETLSETVTSLNDDIIELGRTGKVPYINAYAFVNHLQGIGEGVLKSEQLTTDQGTAIFCVLLASAAKILGECKKDRDLIAKNGISESGIIWIPKSEC